MEVTIMLQENRNLLPRKDVRITGITATPYDDRRRVRVEIEITPFAERPNLDISIQNERGQVVASASAIAIMNLHCIYVKLASLRLNTPYPSSFTMMRLINPNTHSPCRSLSPANPPPSCSKNMRLWRAQAPRKIRLNKQAKLGGHSDFGYTSMSQNHVI